MTIKTVATHTPGPWEADCGEIFTADQTPIVAESANMLSADENAANLLLCAAAPDLLAAAKKAAEALPFGNPIYDLANQALRAAIAKAEVAS